MNLNLGCGRDIRDGFVNVDMVAGHGVDVVHDLNDRPWPWAHCSIAEIVAVDVVEHLSMGLVAFMDQCWIVLENDGLLTVRTPSPTSPNRWRDPTHIRPFHPDSFRYFDPDSEWYRYGHLYTDRPWHVESVIVDAAANVVAKMRPIKHG